MERLSNYNLTLKRWKLPYFKKYVRGEITYKEYAPSISDFCRTVKKFIPILYSVVIGQIILGKFAGGLNDKKRLPGRVRGKTKTH